MKTGLFLLAWLATLGVGPLNAAGNSTDLGFPDTGELTQRANPAREAPQPMWFRDTLTGDWGGERKTLAGQGLTITPTWTQEVFGNPTGGFKQGAVGDGQLNLALDEDLAKATGSPDAGLLHANFLYLYGPSLDTHDLGDFSDVSSITGYNTFRMQEFWYQQPFWQQKASLKIGYIAVDTEFFTSNTSALFIDGTFGAFTFIAVNDPSSPTYPLSSPGLRFNVKPTDQFYLQAGIFTGDNGAQDQNKNGFDFRVNSAGGIFAIGEVGYLLNQGPNDQGLAGTYKLGSFLQSTSYPTYDSQVSHAIAGTALDEQGPEYGIYGVVDQQIYKDASRSISFFLRPGYAPANISDITPYVDVGFNFSGFIPGRGQDLAGLAAARSWVGGAYNHYNQKINGAQSETSETVLEATYRVQISPWWTLQPDVQYFVQPGGASTAHDALVLGARSTIQF